MLEASTYETSLAPLIIVAGLGRRPNSNQISLNLKPAISHHLPAALQPTGGAIPPGGAQ